MPKKTELPQRRARSSTARRLTDTTVPPPAVHAELLDTRLALERQSRLFDTLLSSIADFVYVFDTEGRFVFANQPLADLLRTSREAMVGKNFFDLGYPEDLATKLQAQIRQVVETKEVVRDETLFTGGAGMPGSYEYIFRPILDGDGSVEAVAGSTRDVTERRKVEESLRASEHRFRQFAENSGDVVWMVNADTLQVEYVSPVYERVWGEPRDLLLADIRRWRELVHPHDAELAGSMMPKVLAGETITAEYRIFRQSDGAIRWIRDTGFPIREESGRIVCVAGIAHDITDDKERVQANLVAEERFRLLVEGAPDYAVFLLENDGTITYWSTGAEKVFGWSAEEVVGRPGSMIFTPEDRANGTVERELQMAAQNGFAPDLRWHLRKDQTRLWVDGVMRRLDNKDGTLRGFAKIARDATDVRLAEQRLRDAHEQLEHRVHNRTMELQAMNETLEQEMARRHRLEQEILEVTERERARISQDLHDSLCQELTATAFLLKSRAKALGRLDPEAGEAITEAAEMVNKNAGLARDLARGLHSLELGSGGLVFALRELASRTSETVTCRCVCPRSMRVPSEAVAVNLYRIAQEAVTNALKHAKPTEVVICIARVGDEIVLSIQDNGKARRKAKSKQGLGVRMMQYRASVSGGSFTLETKRSGGTKVTCRVPWKE